MKRTLKEQIIHLQARHEAMLRTLLQAHREVTKLTGQNGMDPEHPQWIQDLFMEVEMASIGE